MIVVLLKNTSPKRLSKEFLRKERKLSNMHLLLTFQERISKYCQMKFQMLHCTFKLSMCRFYESIFVAKSFLPVQMFRELLERTISFKEVSMIYKLSLVYIESHCFSKVSVKAFIFKPCCLLVQVPESLLVGKFCSLRAQNWVEWLE